MKDTADGATKREILVGLAAGGVASRAAAQEVTMIVPFQIPRDPEGLADLERRAHDDAVERRGRLRLVLRNGAGISPKPRRLLAGPPLIPLGRDVALAARSTTRAETALNSSPAGPAALRRYC
jgi:hypothetical protein